MNRNVLILMYTAFFVSFSWAISDPLAEELFSSSVSEFFLTLGNEIYSQNPEDPESVELAMTFLEGAIALDSHTETGWHDVLRIGSSATGMPGDYSQSINLALSRYISPRTNLAVIENAVAYLLNQQNIRQEREDLLARILVKYGRDNQVFGSDLATHLAMLEAERADGSAALMHLQQAMQMDPYNSLAFEAYNQMTYGTEAAPTAINIARQYRYAVERNPLDLQAVLVFANYLRQMQVYEIAVQVFSYASELFQYLYPEQNLPPEIYLPWARCCMKQDSTFLECLEITEQIRKTGRFDLRLEALAVKAKLLLGRDKSEWNFLQLVGKKAEQAVRRESTNLPVTPQQLCWFYCFALPEPEKALAWGHEAISENKEDPSIQSLFGYALLMNGQVDLASQYVSPHQDQQAVAKLAHGIIGLVHKKKAESIEKIRQAAVAGPETLVGIRAIEILLENQSDYIPETSPLGIEQMLLQEFGRGVLPAFRPASELIEAKLNFPGSEAIFGRDLTANLMIKNLGSTNGIVRDGALFQGDVRIDVSVRGDLNIEIPELIHRRFRPAGPIQPNHHAAIKLNLLAGKLRGILNQYPQANLELDFQVWLDPIQTESGSLRKRYSDLLIPREIIKRGGVVINREFLLQRLDVVSGGQEGQKLKVSRLFSGLLAEQAAGDEKNIPYRYIQIERTLLLDSLRMLLKDVNWTVRAHTLSVMAEYSFPINFDLILAISDNLNHEKWPVRFLAMYVLSRAESKNFQIVLDWKAQNDPYWLNRRMAIALGGRISSPRQEQKNEI